MLLAVETLDAKTERRLERAQQHVAAHWIPVNKAFLGLVREGLAKGRYDLDVEFLIQEVRQDFGLLSLIIRELSLVAKKELASQEVLKDPLKLLRWAGVSRLRDVICNSKISDSHDLFDLTENQSQRLRETVVAASTTETLSEKSGVEPLAGYTHAIVRQLGTNLIAWNYPTVFQRVVKSLTPKIDLEDALAKELGFSPTLLATSLLGLPAPGADTKAAGQAVLHELCAVGEALARASDPDVYPNAETDWNEAKEHIEKRLGASGVTLIRQRISENTERYKQVIPEVFQSLTVWDPEEIVHRHKRSLIANDNPFLKACAPHVRQMIKDLYSRTIDARIDRDALEFLVRKIIPQAGFTGALIYVLDPPSMKLVPYYRGGKITLRTLEPIKWQRPLPDSPIMSEWEPMNEPAPTDLVTAALVCDNPLIERNLSREGEQAALGMYASLGLKRRVGVLYLEVPAELADSSATLPVSTLKALRHVLGDILRIN